MEPPEELLDELSAHIERLYNENAETVVESEYEPSELNTVVEECDEEFSYCQNGVASYRSLFLTIPRSDEIVVVGAIALVPGEFPLKHVEYEFLIQVARGIYDAGDVHTVYFGLPTVANS